MPSRLKLECSRAKANKVQTVDELKIEEVFAETGDDTPVTSEESKAVAGQINKKLAEINDLDDEDSKDVKKN